MIKIILYTLLFGVGGYYAVGYIPDSVKGKFLSTMGIGAFKDNSFVIFNPAAKRADILQKLETNVSKLEQIQSGSGSSGNSVDSPRNANINIKGDPIEQDEVDAVIEESKALLEEMKELNPKTGILPGIVGKIFGVGSDSQQQQAITADQITPELKEQICK
jgi:hypothetical protein